MLFFVTFIVTLKLSALTFYTPNKYTIYVSDKYEIKKGQGQSQVLSEAFGLLGSSDLRFHGQQQQPKQQNYMNTGPVRRTVRLFTLLPNSTA